MNTRCCRLAACFLVLAATLTAQTYSTNWNPVKALATGTEVRVAAGTRTISGKVDTVTDGAIAITAKNGSEMFTRQEVRRVSVRSRTHRKRNTLIGLGIGAGAGLAFGGLVANDASGSFFGGHGPRIIATSTAAGALVGVLVGAAIPTSHWREIYKK